MPDRKVTLTCSDCQTVYTANIDQLRRDGQDAYAKQLLNHESNACFDCSKNGDAQYNPSKNGAILNFN